MVTLSYAEAVTHSLDRLSDVGFEHGSAALVNHAPMAAEAIAHAGYSDTVPAWVDRNLRVRRYHELPGPRWTIDAQDNGSWVTAVGAYERVSDWTAMFERELAERDWHDVLAEWWPRLLPGMSGSLTHGVIRTAHAVRALAVAGAADPLRRGELARGLAYWAARYSGPRPMTADIPPAADTVRTHAEVAALLDRLVADNAGHYAEQRPHAAIPLIHAITAPAAVRLVCEHLPADAQWTSYLAVAQCCATMRGWFAEPSRPAPPAGEPPVPAAAEPSGPVPPPAEPADDLDDLMAVAVDLGDEHAIKLAEVAVRHHALLPDERYAAATRWALRQIGRTVQPRR